MHNIASDEKKSVYTFVHLYETLQVHTQCRCPGDLVVADFTAVTDAASSALLLLLCLPVFKPFVKRSVIHADRPMQRVVLSCIILCVRLSQLHHHVCMCVYNTMHVYMISTTPLATKSHISHGPGVGVFGNFNATVNKL